MLAALDSLSTYPYYIQFTLNAYDQDLEPGLPSLQERVNTFVSLSQKIGPERVLWRYDPILLSHQYPQAFHEESFGRLASSIEKASERVTISFIDFYPGIQRRMDRLGIREASPTECLSLVKSLLTIATSHGLTMVACAEAQDFSAAGVGRASCIDAALLSRISGKPLFTKKDPHQRPGCGCAASVDIGAYDTCPHECAYCYANHGKMASLAYRAGRDLTSPFLLP